MKKPAKSHISLLDSVFSDIWIGGDLDKIDDYFHADVKIYGIVPDVPLTRSEYRDWVEQFFALAKMGSYRIGDSIYGDQGQFAHRFVSTLTAVSTGKTGSINGMAFGHIQDDKLISVHTVLDQLSFFEEIGLLPESSSLLLLSGTPLS